jgi:malonate decarboxylase epsilon subunit
MMSTVYLYPGQGAQMAGMLHELPDHPVVRSTLLEACETLGLEVLSLDEESALSSTVNVQLSLLIAGVASARLLQSEGGNTDMAAGHSVGAFAAAVHVQSLAFSDALEIVKMRGQWMEAAYPQHYGMGVVTGLTAKQLASIVERASTLSDPVFISNLNAPRQITVSGSVAAIERVFTEARNEGCSKAMLLSIKVPSHCKLMHSVGAKLAEQLGRTPLHPPKAKYVANRTARILRSADAIREDLAWGVAFPVRWHEMTSLLYELGGRLFIEMIPGRTLTGLANAAFHDARSVSLKDIGWLTAVALEGKFNAKDDAFL